MEMKNKPHRQLIGALIHLSNTVRPDIAFAVNYLSRFIESPVLSHWNAAKLILKYLNTQEIWASLTRKDRIL